MKKSIKYAGIAAATLLAVAPVAAPVVSQAADTATTQAAGNTDSTTVGDTITKITDQFGNLTLDDNNTDAIIDAIKQMNTFGGQNPLTVDKALEDAGTKHLMSSPAAKAIDLTPLTDIKASLYFTAKDATGKTYDGVSDGQRNTNLAAAMASDKRMPVTITMHFVSTELNSIPTDKSTYSFTIDNETDNELKTINASFDTPITVAKDSKTIETQLVNTGDLKITDQDGNSLSLNQTSIGPKFYAKYDDAVNMSNPIDQVNGSDIKGGEFKSAGTYYQRITFTANQSSALESFLEAYNKDNSVDPDYTVTVNGKNAKAGVDFTTYKQDNGLQDITFIRAIHVSDSTAEWTTTENKGIVTTKADTPYYTLVNDNGDKITNRALAKNTAWVTDQKRVDQNGNTQYRVATGEWIDANNVTFSDKATTDEGAYTDEQALNGKVTLDGPSSFIYMLYNDNGENISNRALAGDSEWYTDKKATNAAGVTVYHVATGEWVQAGNGVNYSAY